MIPHDLIGETRHLSTTNTASISEPSVRPMPLTQSGGTRLQVIENEPATAAVLLETSPRPRKTVQQLPKHFSRLQDSRSRIVHRVLNSAADFRGITITR